jgi:mRNA-degrading endonuclease toxin of MazEF toxin-antitoxin module
MKRGDVVILDFPFKTGGSKVRPALIVQDDRWNQATTAIIVALITGNLVRKGEPTHSFVDPNDPDFAGSGLHAPSLVNCSHLYTVDQGDIQRVIGCLSASAMQAVDGCLKASLGIS